MLYKYRLLAHYTIAEMFKKAEPIWTRIWYGRQNLRSDLFGALANYYRYFDELLQLGGCNYAMSADTCKIGGDEAHAAVEHHYVWKEYSGHADDTFDNQIRAMTASCDFNSTLIDPDLKDSHPIEYTMFHICTTIMFDFIVYNKNIFESDLLNVKQFLLQQDVNKDHANQFGDIEDFRNSVNVSNLMRNLWQSLRTTYVLLSPEYRQGMWTMVCEEVTCSIIRCGIKAIETDIMLHARYKARISNTNPYYKCEHRDNDPYHKYERRTHDDVAIFSTQKWQPQKERDYTEKIFYFAYTSAPLDAFWQTSDQLNSTYLLSYKRVFDMFRLLHLRIDNVAAHRPLTDLELRQCSIEYDRWGFAYSMRSLLLGSKKLVKERSDRQKFARALAINENLICKTITLPEAYQKTLELSA